MTIEQNKNIEAIQRTAIGTFPQPFGFAVDKSGDKAVAHLLAIMFFSGLLVVLAVILEQIVKGHWTEIVAALRGDPVETVRRTMQPAGRRAAA